MSAGSDNVTLIFCLRHWQITSDKQDNYRKMELALFLGQRCLLCGPTQDVAVSFSIENHRFDTETNMAKLLKQAEREDMQQMSAVGVKSGSLVRLVCQDALDLSAVSSTVKRLTNPFGRYVKLCISELIFTLPLTNMRPSKWTLVCLLFYQH